MDNILNARIKLKYDTYEHWESVKNSFKPLAGEVILYQIPAQQTSTGLTPPTVGVKVGDGTNYLKDLPWIQAIAGDVYSWAKQVNKPIYDATEINNTSIEKKDVVNNSSSTENATVQEVLAWLKDQIDSMGGGAGSIATQIDTKIGLLDVDNDTTSDLTHHITGFGSGKTLATLTEQNGYINATFQDIGIAESQVTSASGGWITDGLAAKAPLASPALTGTPTAPTATAGTNTTQIATTAFVKDAVDTATAGLTGAMHYIGALEYDPTVRPPEPATIHPGDVGTYGNKEYVVDNNYAWRELGDEGSYALKTITVTGSNGLTGGGAISSNQVISHATKPDTSTTPDSTVGSNAARTYVKQVKLDAYGHVIDVTTGAETVVDNNTTYTFAQGDNDGEIKITATPNVNGTAGTAASPISVKPKNLKTIATTGSAYDLNEVNTSTSTASDGQKFFILDCGDASHFIDNRPTT